MRYIFLLVLILANTTLLAQTDEYVGEYGIKHELLNAGVLEYNLSLKPDGTFIFHSYRNIDPSQPKENIYGQGKWTVEKNNLIYFYTSSENDLDETHTLNFTDTKARIIKKSPRNLSKKDIKEAILFYNSEIFWVEGWKLFKKFE